DIASLLLRQRLTGRDHPPAAKAMMAAHSGEIEALAGASLDRLAQTNDLHDQEAFARLARNVIRDLNLDEEGGDEQGAEQTKGDEEENAKENDSSENEDDGVAEAAEDQTGDESEGPDSESDVSEQDFEQAEDDADGAVENAKISSIRAKFEGDSGARYRAYT